MTVHKVTTPKSRCKKKPIGFQPGNQVNTRHGLRGSGLPAGCSYLEGQLLSFRRHIREQIGGELTVYQEALLQSAGRHETRALLASRWLRLHAGELSHSDRLAYLKAVSDATDSRDKCLDRMGLDRDRKADIIASLYSRDEPRKEDGKS